MGYAKYFVLRLLVGYAIFFLVCLLGVVSFDVLERWEVHVTFAGIVVVDAVLHRMTRSALKSNSDPRLRAEG